MAKHGASSSVQPVVQQRVMTKEKNQLKKNLQSSAALSNRSAHLKGTQ